MSEGELIAVLSSSIYPGAKPESIKLAIAYCRGAHLDPLQKPVHIVPMDVKTGRKDERGKDVYEKRDVIMPGIGRYRVQAARTGEYAGMPDPEFGPTKTITFNEKDDGPAVTMEYPEWCRVVVRRVVEGKVVDFSAVEYWLENYATAGNWTKAPNKMWKKRPRGQIAKCAEAQALRKAFPEVGAQPTAEEMEGKTIDAEGVVVPSRPQIEGPQSKSRPSTVDAETGEIVESKPAHGAAPDAVASQPMKPSQSKIILAKLKNAGMTNADLEAAFQGKSLEPKAGRELFSFGDFAALVEWISKNAKG
jgi:phage recombination protein Bet